MQIIKREELPEQRQVRLTIAVDKDTWQASLAKCYQGCLLYTSDAADD